MRQSLGSSSLLGVLIVLFCSQPMKARAGNFWETVGISTAVGTTLGLSTIPFYSEPSNHLVNVGIGAGIGLVFGLGILTYHWLSPSGENDQLGWDSKPNPVGLAKSFKSTQNLAFNQTSTTTSLWNRARFRRSEVTVWTPVVSLNW